MAVRKKLTPGFFDEFVFYDGKLTHLQKEVDQKTNSSPSLGWRPIADREIVGAMAMVKRTQVWQSGKVIASVSPDLGTFHFFLSFHAT